MRRITNFIASLGAFALFALPVKGDLERVSLADVPANVIASLKAKFPNAKLVSAVRGVENGETQYEIRIIARIEQLEEGPPRLLRRRARATNITYKDQEIEVGLKTDGSIYEMEKTIDARELPPRVAATLSEKYSDAAVQKVEEVTKKDKLAHYEIKLMSREKKPVEVEIAPNGKVLKEEEQKRR